MPGSDSESSDAGSFEEFDTGKPEHSEHSGNDQPKQPPSVQYTDLNTAFKEALESILSNLLEERKGKNAKDEAKAELRYGTFDDHVRKRPIPLAPPNLEQKGKAVYACCKETDEISKFAYLYLSLTGWEETEKDGQSDRSLRQGTFVRKFIIACSNLANSNMDLYRIGKVDIINQKRKKPTNSSGCGVKSCARACLKDEKYCQDHMFNVFKNLPKEEQNDLAEQFLKGQRKQLTQFKKVLECCYDFESLELKIKHLERNRYTLTEAGRKYVDEFKERIKAGNVTVVNEPAKKRAKLLQNASPTSVQKEDLTSV